MRIAMFSDTHLDGKYGDVPREDDMACAIDEVINGIGRAGVDRVAILGDLFDTPAPSVSAVCTAVSMLMRLAEIAPVTVLAGNHDVRERDDLRDGLSVIEALQHERIVVVRTTQSVGWATAAPHLPRWVEDDGDVNAMIAQDVGEAMENGERLFIGHLNIVGAHLGPSDVYERGHNAKYRPTWPIETMKAHGPVTVHIPGSLVRMGFSEAGDRKSYLIVDTEKLVGTHIFNGHYHAAATWTA